MSHFVCPVCGKPLERQEKVYLCENLHSFDISKKGYVNLLLSSSSGKVHGDDKAMVSARAEFLAQGFYDDLSGHIAALAETYCPNGGVILDAGCGEGKYTSDIAAALKRSGKCAEVVGVDISKDAVNLAAGRDKTCRFAVASAAKLPMAEDSTDVMISIFAPFFAEEFLRVLKDDGVIIRAYPLARHLWELKELVYDTPYENPETDMEEDGFEIAGRHELRYKIMIERYEDIKNLFVMTPYFYRTSEEDTEKLSHIDKLGLSLEFGIVVYKKKPRA